MSRDCMVNCDILYLCITVMIISYPSNHGTSTEKENLAQCFSSSRYKRFLSCLGCSRWPVQNIFPSQKTIDQIAIKTLNPKGRLFLKITTSQNVYWFLYTVIQLFTWTRGFRHTGHKTTDML
jgi:hypothetical protein